jgi:predicted small lipoprotein YifL
MSLNWKRALSALTAIALLLSFAACAKGGTDTASSSDATSSDAAYTDEELAQVAVKIGDDFTITKGDIVDEYDYMVQMYSYYGMSAPTATEDIEAMQDDVISTLVADKIQLYEAKLMGVTLTDDQKADARRRRKSRCNITSNPSVPRRRARVPRMWRPARRRSSRAAGRRRYGYGCGRLPRLCD